MDNRHFIARRAARYFHSGDVVNLGIGIPSLCGNYAESGVLFQTENGFIGVGATAQGIEIGDRLFNAGGIPYLPALGGCAFDVAKSFGIIRSGRMAATVLGALQVSQHGDLANWATPDRAFGMGGAMIWSTGPSRSSWPWSCAPRTAPPSSSRNVPCPIPGGGAWIISSPSGASSM